ncbi:MAG TPA: hypothetical protein PLR20_03880 [Syntrophales bacterium]|jgi:hypothetical protein|nr:hypothetical protein [Syntrophales bacterium]HOX93617.1 hypothetical protein [Syntrophales bacterium]HPI57814.1 hypothetical protein [Syntrophales bacterium]HPN25528.1 hypothetical protein [Syntrophales bacterium]HQM28474.1 hypothetical protein [Syntrophales bacterium]
MSDFMLMRSNEASGKGKQMKSYKVQDIGDVGAVLYGIVVKYDKTGFAEARMVPTDQKAARHIVDGFLNYVRGRHEQSHVPFNRLSLVYERATGDQIGSFILGMGKPMAKPKKPSSRKAATTYKRRTSTKAVKKAR